ncbi:serine/threonine-protein kinase [Nocardiopsis sp. CNT312]|uniref:serine/threonine-protein kinase n=1 Tax=Nocardiopsis sp. CNT312 TaxID=1137268 RepID=UPI0004AFDBDE|nr:serine/threonine-protein kinase [Nocardiopsis sp. CNT312]
MKTSPRIAGRYRLDELIATGGMSAVWRGHDTRLDRTVAVKLLKDTAFQDNRQARERFEREAQAAARLNGHGFAAVYDRGEDTVGPDSLAYLVMELVEGESLAALIERRGKLPPARVMEITASVATALETVHSEGIVHRDIKPANILIERGGTVKLVDFGIARISGTASLTSTGTVLGTPVYASPEQLTLDEITGLADVYSLGVVAYHALAGKPPFTADDHYRLLSDHVSSPPPPLPSDVPKQVAAVVMRALAKDPRERWGSAEELAAACRTAAAGRTDPPNTRRPLALPVALLASCLAVLLLSASLLLWSPWSEADGGESAQGPVVSGSRATAPGQDGSEPAAEPATDTDDRPGHRVSDPGGSSGAQETPGTAPSPTGPAASPEGGTDPGPAPSPADPGQTPQPTGGTVPDVVGTTTFQALQALRGQGFGEVSGEHRAPGLLNLLIAPATCEVESQSPAAGTTAGLGDPVVLTYYAPSADEDCGL